MAFRLAPPYGGLLVSLIIVGSLVTAFPRSPMPFLFRIFGTVRHPVTEADRSLLESIMNNPFSQAQFLVAATPLGNRA